jgi:hypothetical protein
MPAEILGMELSFKILKAASKIHNELEPSFLGSLYEEPLKNNL